MKKYISLITIISFIFISCSDKKNEDNPRATAEPTNPRPNCDVNHDPNCVPPLPNGAYILATSLGKAKNYAREDLFYLGLTFTTDSSNQVDPNNPRQYRGNATAQGFLIVHPKWTTEPDYRFCPIPPGQYFVTGGTNYWQGQSFFNLNLEGTNGFRISIRLPNNYILSAVPKISDGQGRLYDSRLQNTMLIQSFNGQSCGSSLFFNLE